MKKIAVATGSRADYGLLSPLLKLLKDDLAIELQLIACAAHLSSEFGMTKNFIEQDGFLITAEVEMDIFSDSPEGVTRSMGLGCIGFGEIFSQLKPDLLVLLGDRFETLAAAQAAMVAKIPIAHLHGGELTEGAIDDVIRHAITKMSHLHFVATSDFRNRVIQMGEDPKSVFMVGAIGLDNIYNVKSISKEEIESELGIRFDKPVFLATYHPVTLSSADQTRAIQNMFAALDKHPDALIIFTYSNSDTFGRQLIKKIENYAKENPFRVIVRPSLGQKLYLGVMKMADLVIGNSSSGLIEAPSFGVPTVNIGIRQKGRPLAPSVISCKENSRSISEAITRALTPEFYKIVSKRENPYGDGKTAEKIYKIISEVNFDNILIKSFYDLPNVNSL